MEIPFLSNKMETQQNTDFNENRNAYYGDLHTLPANIQERV